MVRKEGVKEHREKCHWCESIRVLRGTRRTFTDSEGNERADGHWEIERTGFKCTGHNWRKIK
jgi:hypothetical protein